MSDKDPSVHNKKRKTGITRRGFLGASAVAGAAGITGVAGVAGLASGVMTREAFAAAAQDAMAKATVHPGELDEYYGFWRWPPGEVRVLGIPSMREIDAHSGI